jgi:hypothetical protein
MPRCQSRVPRYRAPPPPSFAQTCNLTRCEAPASPWVALCCTSILRCGRQVTCGLLCVQETIPAFKDGNWHVSLHPLPPFLKRYGPEEDMLRQLQTSSVAVVKDCFHAAEVACAEDFFEDPLWVVSRVFKRRALVRSRPPSGFPRPILVVASLPLSAPYFYTLGYEPC